MVLEERKNSAGMTLVNSRVHIRVYKDVETQKKYYQPWPAGTRLREEH